LPIDHHELSNPAAKLDVLLSLVCQQLDETLKGIQSCQLCKAIHTLLSAHDLIVVPQHVQVPSESDKFTGRQMSCTQQ